MKEIAISIDIGGTNTKVALVAAPDRIIAQKSISTTSCKSKQDFFKALFSTIEILCKNLPKNSEIKGIGIGALGCNETEGSIDNTANLSYLGRIDIVEKLNTHFQIPVYLTKDSFAAAIGEHKYGAAKGLNNFAILTLGTGLGSAMFVNGRLMKGQHGLGGELGHVIIKPDGRSCGCGRKGCLETYVSATGIKRTVFQLLADSREASTLRTISFKDLTSKAIFDAATQEDPIALQAFEYTGGILGRKLADIMTYFVPEAFILAGGLSKAGDLLFHPTRRSLEKNTLNIYKGKGELIPSALKENEAALLGAASLVWEKQRVLTE